MLIKSLVAHWCYLEALVPCWEDITTELLWWPGIAGFSQSEWSKIQRRGEAKYIVEAGERGHFFIKLW
jgi:hypothetical protein